MNNNLLERFYIFAILLLFRVTGAVATTVTTLNPDSSGDADVFGKTAETIARGLRAGRPYLYTSKSIDITQFFIPFAHLDIDILWGTFLAPFWLLPGPSGFYARLGNAFLAAFAIHNVYIIAHYCHSHRAGVLAALPMIFYPSFVAVQTTLLREAVILFGITTAARLLIVPSRRRSRLLSYAFSGIVLHISLLFRPDNMFIFIPALIGGLSAYALKSGGLPRRLVAIFTSLSPVATVLSLPVIRSGIEFINYTRRVRAGGRAVYLAGITPQTIAEFIAFSWIGAAYFLYAPFPWMIKTIPDLIVGTEGLINIAFTVSAIWGVQSFNTKNVPVTVGLLTGLSVAVVLYGAGTVNYGTGMRHRQMFLWVIFLFGGIGLSERLRFV